jgi:hypothetical protein
VILERKNFFNIEIVFLYRFDFVHEVIKSEERRREKIKIIIIKNKEK